MMNRIVIVLCVNGALCKSGNSINMSTKSIMSLIYTFIYKSGLVNLPLKSLCHDIVTEWDGVRFGILTLVLFRWFQTVTLCVTRDAPGLPDGLQLLVKLILETHRIEPEI